METIMPAPECAVVYPWATQTTGRRIRCTLTAGHAGDHRDYTEAYTGEILVWARESVDPTDPLGRHQPRDHSVPCRQCGQQTWHYRAICSVCLQSGAPV